MRRCRDRVEGSDTVENSLVEDLRILVYDRDLCHRDGVIKDEVAINPGKYIIEVSRHAQVNI